MKLSAPPPPPPEPNDPDASRNPAPAAGATTADVPPTDASGAPILSTMTPRKELSWPAWFTGADFLLTVLVLVLAFLVSSFVARNSDLWLHLAAGKRLLAGEYTPGTDPFSFAAAGRTWVNHSILFDVAAYLLYSGNGMLLVVLKALAVVAALALVIGLRRPGYSLLPWAGVGLVAVFAVAPFTFLKPLVGSLFLFAITLFLLFRGNYRPGSWVFPIAIGVTFWLWANVDEWFFLGPLTVALVLAGELIQRQVGKPTESRPDGSDEPLGAPPDVPRLAKALGIGIVACMLNPHHIHIWQMPLELTGARELAVDPRFRQLLLSPLNQDYYASSPQGRANGNNVNGLAFAILFVAGGAALGLAGSRMRFSHLLLWVGFAVLSLQTVLMIPFVALLAVPLVASQLNAFSSRVKLTTWGDPKSRLLLIGSSFGRVLVLLFAIVACVLAWPGWLHPSTGNEAYAKRVGWEVEVDQGMVRGAEELQAWRTGDHPRLSPEARGLALSLEFANYCAWFAPQEKVFANTRYRHHRPELGTYTTVRKGLGLLVVPEEDVPTPKELNDTLEELGVEYLVIHTSPGDPANTRFLAQQASQRQWFRSDMWSPWYLDGRSTISGWRKAPGKEKPSFKSMRFDPLVLAFGPDVKPLPAGSISPIQKPGGWEDAFLRSPRLTPPGVYETLGWEHYKEAKTLFALQELHTTWRSLQILGNQLAGGWETVAGLEARLFGLSPDYPIQDELRAIPFLALRAAYRAIASDPNHPDGYLALAAALEDRNFPMDESQRVIGRITALRQCLARLPSPENNRYSGYRARAFDVARIVANLYLGRPEDATFRGPVPIIGFPINHMSFRPLNQPRDSGYLPATSIVYPEAKGRIGRQWIGSLPQLPPQLPSYARIVLLPLDDAKEMLQLARQYLIADPPSDAEVEEKQKEAIDRDLKAVEEELIRANNRYAQRQLAGGGQLKLETQVEAALQNNLVGEALRLLRENADNLGKEFGARAPQVLLSQIALEMAIGRIEEAAADLDALENDGGLQKLLADPNFRQVVQMLRFHKCVMEGNFAGAGGIIESLEGEYSTRDVYRDARKKFDPNPFVKAGMQSVALWQFYSPLTAILAPTPGDLLSRLFAPTIVIDGTGNNVGFASLQYQLSRLRQTEGEFYLRRGMLSLQEGDIKAARQRFLQTRDTPEQQAENARWGLPNRQAPQAELYLRLIDKAAARAHQK